ncbi:phosphatase PAP2 family protein [Gordonia sp. FQ]|uniref:phosphatase PAP2 family protein n=1 Tax=Gordonia sp. FQ TaxID=3446634 RepID=UPI003F85643E
MESVRGRQQLGIVFFALAVLGAGLFAAHPGPLGIDTSVLHGLASTRNPGLTTFVDDLSYLFSPVATTVAAGVIAVVLLLRDRSLRRALPVGASVAIAAGVAGVLKLATARPRPPEYLQVGSPEATYSYPSGHVTGTSALVVALLVVVVSTWPRHRAIVAGVLGAAVVAICAWTRLYLGMHWFTDVTGAVLLGLSAGLLVPPVVDLLLARLGPRLALKEHR